MNDRRHTSGFTDLNASDSHTLQAYYAAPIEQRAAVVIIQEIFGVNSHIRSVVDDYASEGFLAIAPALFDRVERGVELSYNPADQQRGRTIARSIGENQSLLDISAAVDWARHRLPGKKVFVVGYCWGGTLAWLAATRLHPDAAVGYYGGGIADHAAETLSCPVMLHFGSRDAHIPPEKIDPIRRSHPEVPIYMYDAGHGFNCDQRESYNPEAAQLARSRTLESFRSQLLPH